VETLLFRTRDNRPVTDRTIAAALEAVRAYDAKVLYMHTELSFGMPVPGLSRGELLSRLFAVIRETGVPTLCVPTFTFSFCNGEDYDVQRSASKMGVLNEYIRKLPDAVRSVDPLLSVAAVGEDRELAGHLGHHSIGADSTFDKLHRRDGVKFLFFGASPSKCFTHTHYVEERERVPYRYDREFTGSITNGSDVRRETYTLFVRYRNVVPTPESKFESFMLEKGLMTRAVCGDSAVSCVDEPVAYQAVVDKLRSDVDYFLAAPYPREGLDPEFRVTKMVAL
jgi:aminoglycoside 3-N-acetyltransferase